MIEEDNFATNYRYMLVLAAVLGLYTSVESYYRHRQDLDHHVNLHVKYHKHEHGKTEDRKPKYVI